MCKKALQSFVYMCASVMVFTLMLTGITQAQEDEFSFEEDASYYQLASPGILSDHPLYVFKKLRDFVIEMATKDPGEKASLYLEYADKRIGEASELLKKGKTVAAINAVVESQELFAKIPALVQEARESEGELEDGFVEKLKLSNAKHYDITNHIKTDLPADNIGNVEQAIQQNRETKDKIEKL